jgi:RNA polymerase sigma-70 factor (ECF subfamily)
MKRQDREDSALVGAVMDGDVNAFAKLFSRYRKPLYNAAYRITGNRQDALDATQSAFANAYAALSSFDRSRSFFSWIFRIVVNESTDVARRRETQLEPETADGLLEMRPDPEESLHGSESDREVRRAIQRLKPDYRAVIVLRHFLELSYAEIADAVGVPEKTVKSRLFTARQSLKELLTAPEVGGAKAHGPRAANQG